MDSTSFLRMVNSPVRFRFFLLWKLPSAWFMGISVKSCDGRRAEIRLPYGWRSQNPFKSIYFAAQCAAGELSTGLLATNALQGKPSIAMLATHVEAQYTKKASQMLTFTCEDGDRVQETIQTAIETGVSQSIRMESIGRLPDGTEASRVWITWSFKVR